VVVVTLDRPRAKNRMTPALQGALREAFETLHGADHVRLVLIRGAGGHFCAGHDPEWMRLSFDWTEADLRDDALDLGRTLKALHDVPALTVALVEGEAYGPGMGLVAACDMALATETARFGFPELKLGLLPSVSAPYLADAVGPRHAQALLGTGRTIDAGEAQRIGLVQDVAFDEPALAALAERLTGDALACAPEAAAEVKRLAWRVWGRPIDHGMLDETARRSAARRVSPEGIEGVQAYLDGRSPNWNP
jgi:methylglutaconyl-CoA hydratase